MKTIFLVFLFSLGFFYRIDFESLALSEWVTMDSVFSPYIGHSLHEYLLYPLIKLQTPNETILRLPSALAGMFSLFLTVSFFHELRWKALSLVLMASTYANFYFFREASPHAFIVLANLGALYFLVEKIRQAKPWILTDGIKLSLLLTLAVMFDDTGFIIAGASLLSLLVFRKNIGLKVVHLAGMLAMTGGLLLLWFGAGQGSNLNFYSPVPANLNNHFILIFSLFSVLLAIFIFSRNSKILSSIERREFGGILVFFFFSTALGFLAYFTFLPEITFTGKGLVLLSTFILVWIYALQVIAKKYPLSASWLVWGFCLINVFSFFAKWPWTQAQREDFRSVSHYIVNNSEGCKNIITNSKPHHFEFYLAKLGYKSPIISLVYKNNEGKFNRDCQHLYMVKSKNVAAFADLWDIYTPYFSLVTTQSFANVEVEYWEKTKAIPPK